MKSILKFLRQLAAHNDREWFNSHKEEYLKIKKKADALTERLIEAVATVDSEAERLTVADCTYRIYRDTRFSVDKTPYKTHIGIFINPPFGKKSNRCGYYLHIEPGNCFFAAGTIGLPSTTVGRIRRSIFDEIDEYRSIVEDEEFRKWFVSIGENPVKTAPKGFDREWEFMDYVKPRDFVASTDILPEDFITDKNLPDLLLPAIRQARRFNDFINYSIDDE